MTPRLAFRRLATVAASSLLVVSLASCGDDGDDSDDSGSDDRTSESSDPTDEPTDDTTGSADVTVLEEAQLTDALLTADEVPDGLAETPVDDDDESGGLDGTCLDDIGKLDETPGFEADVKAKRQFELETDTAQNQLTTSLNSYPDVDAVDSALDLFYDTASKCTTIQTTDDEGLEYDLKLVTDDTTTLSGADRQVSVKITGTIAAEAQSFDVAYGFIVANSANNLVALTTSDFGDSASLVDQTPDLAQTPLDKLAAIS